MRGFLKFALLGALLLFVGVPAAFVLFVMVMAMFGVAIGIGSMLVALMLTVLKVALMVILPIALLVWIAKRLFAPERTY